MTKEEHKPTEVSVSLGERGVEIKTIAGEQWLDTVDKFVEQSGYPNRSAAIRSLVCLGMYAYTHNDPRNQTGSDENSGGENSFSPKTIREFIPEGKESAVSIQDELPSQIEKELLDVVEEDPKINRDGWEVYK